MPTTPRSKNPPPESPERIAALRSALTASIRDARQKHIVASQAATGAMFAWRKLNEATGGKGPPLVLVDGFTTRFDAGNGWGHPTLGWDRIDILTDGAAS